MVDLAQMVQKNSKLIPDSAQLVSQILDETVLYKVNGPYRRSGGISCFFPFDGNKKNYGTMLDIGPSSLLAYYGCQFGFIPAKEARELGEICAVVAYEYLNLSIDDEQKKDREEESIAKPKPLPQTLNTPASTIASLEDFPVTLTNKAEAQLTLGPDRVANLDNISFHLAIVDPEEDILVLLGPVFQDTDMGDGQFAFIFTMEDIQKKSAMSEAVFFTIKGGKITVGKDLDKPDEKED